MSNEVTEPKPLWRERASPGRVRAATFVTAVVLLVVGAMIEALPIGWLAGRGAGTVALVGWYAYLLGGVAVLVHRRNRPPVDPQDSWSVLVLSHLIRGRNGRRNLALQILLWLTIGHLMFTAVAVYALIEGIGSLGLP